MTLPPWEKIKSIFQDAADLPVAKRPSFLDQACGNDDSLRREVEKLLAQAEGDETQEIFANRPQCVLQINEVLKGRFRIVRFVGKGGMGEVYEAADLELGGQVAIKTLRPELNDDPEFLGRFRREVQLARQVTHPNVCRVFDVGHETRQGQGLAFLTMEFLDGETLATLLRRQGKLSVADALPIVQQMAAGLGALHDKGIIHRDFKPGNVLVTQSSAGPARAVISDFGLARALEHDATSLSRTGHVLGTPDYMAPEQLLGQPVTPATDIYALGLVMYEMVTGRKAFPGGRPLENAVQRVVEKPSPPKSHSAEISTEWNSVILRCLARDPADRPASVSDVIAALGGQALPSATPSRRTWIAAAGILAVILAAFAWWFRLGDRWPSKVNTQAVVLLPLTVPGDQPELRVFALGLMETITSRLSQFEDGKSPLLVVAASEVRSQQARTARDALQKFQATTAVEGTLQSQGDRVRLLLTLVDTARMIQMETITLEDTRANSWRLQDAAVARLANVLNVRLQAKFAKDQDALPVTPGAYEFYLQARGYLQRSDQMVSLKSAETLLKRALEIDPKFALAHSGLGETYVGQYQLTREPQFMAQALESGATGLSLNPNIVETHVSMGRIHLATGRYDEARQDFEHAIEVDSRSNAAYQGLAESYAKQNDNARAEATFRKAISLRPGDWTGYKALGLYHFGKQEYDKSIENWKRVIELSPDNALGYLNMGSSYALKGDLDQAQRQFEKALELDPVRVGTLSNLGKIYFDKGQFEKSIEMYQRAIKAGSRSYRAWGQLGSASLRAGKAAQAQESFGRAITILEEELLVNPNDALLHSSLAFYRALAGRKDFPAPLQHSLQLAPTAPTVLSQNAETYAVAGDHTNAVALLRKAIAAGESPRRLRSSFYLKDLVTEVENKPKP
jgi:tetratricopeptide (TPR) repeat protein